MSKYKIWSEEDIRNYMKQLSDKTGYYLSDDVFIKIDGRLKRRLGGHYYQFNEDGIIQTIGFKFSKSFMSGVIEEKFVKDVIEHEFCHSWIDNGSKKCAEHGEDFKEKCDILGCQHNIEAEISEIEWALIEASI